MSHRDWSKSEQKLRTVAWSLGNFMSSLFRKPHLFLVPPFTPERITEFFFDYKKGVLK